MTWPSIYAQYNNYSVCSNSELHSHVHNTRVLGCWYARIRSVKVENWVSSMLFVTQLGVNMIWPKVGVSMCLEAIAQVGCSVRPPTHRPALFLSHQPTKCSSLHP